MLRRLTTRRPTFRLVLGLVWAQAAVLQAVSLTIFAGAWQLWSFALAAAIVFVGAIEAHRHLVAERRVPLAAEEASEMGLSRMGNLHGGLFILLMITRRPEDGPALDGMILLGIAGFLPCILVLVFVLWRKGEIWPG